MRTRCQFCLEIADDTTGNRYLLLSAHNLDWINPVNYLDPMQQRCTSDFVLRYGWYIDEIKEEEKENT